MPNLSINDITPDNTITGSEIRSSISLSGTADSTKGGIIVALRGEGEESIIQLDITPTNGEWQADLDLYVALNSQNFTAIENGELDGYHVLEAMYQNDYVKLIDGQLDWQQVEIAEKAFAINVSGKRIDPTDAEILESLLLDPTYEDGSVQQAMNSRLENNFGKGITINYSFATAGSRTDFSLFSDEGKAAVREALKVFEEQVGGLSFNEVDARGDMQFAMITSNEITTHDGRTITEVGNFTPFAWEKLEQFQQYEFGGTVNISKEFEGQWSPGEHGFFLLLHEIGHGLGLDHPFSEYYQTSNGAEVSKEALPSFFQSADFTVMSDPRSDLGPYDIKVLQALYGTKASSEKVNTDSIVEGMLVDYEDDGYVMSSTIPVIKFHGDSGLSLKDGVNITQYSSSHKHTHKTTSGKTTLYDTNTSEYSLEVEANTTGAVEISDVIAQLRHIVGLDTLSGISAANADVDMNDKIEISDVVSSLRIIVGLESAPKARLVDRAGNHKFSDQSLPGELFATVLGDVDLSWTGSDIV